MIIHDPNGTYTGVTSENRLKTRAVTQKHDLYENHTKGNVWSIFFEDINPVGANDKFFYFKNTGSKDYALTDIRASCTTATGRLYIKTVSGTPTFTAGTDLTPTSRNAGKSPSIDATIKSDTDTTGLTDEGDLYYMELSTVSTLYNLTPSSNIIIPPGKAVAFEWGPATGEVTATVSIIELPKTSDI